MEISLLAAFLGGALALLSPCGALLLPGYFASSLTRRSGLLLHGAVFYLGLVLTLVPLGIGAGVVGSLLVAHRSALVAGTSALLIVLGALHLLGIGADPVRILPGLGRVQQASARGSGLLRTLLLGAVGGVAGFCAGPILGAVLTLAVGQGSVAAAAVLLSVYGAGMVVPLMLLTSLWGRLGTRSRALLRGREFTVAGRRLHTTTALTGALIIGVGILFWVTNGLVTMPSLVPARVLTRWQESLASLVDQAGTELQVLIIAGLGLLALALWWRADRRRQASAPQTTGGRG